MPVNAMLTEPVLELRVNGQPAGRVLADLIELTLVNCLNEPASCELLLNNVREDDGQLLAPYLELDELSFGDELQLSVTGADPATLFSGRINRIESRMEKGKRPVFVVQAEDALQYLRLSERTRVYEDATDVDMIESICQDNGLSCDADYLSGPHYRAVTQLNQLDLGFMQQRLQKVGGYAFLDENTLVVRPISIQPALNSELPASEFTRLSIAADVSGQSNTLGVAGWDVQAKQAIGQAAASGDLQPTGISGGGILAQHFADNDKVDVFQVPDDAEQAEATAQSLYLKQALQFVTGSGELRGFYLRRPGHTVTLTNLGDSFSGTFLVSQRVLHYDQESGFSTQLRLHSATLSQH